MAALAATAEQGAARVCPDRSRSSDRAVVRGLVQRRLVRCAPGHRRRLLWQTRRRRHGGCDGGVGGGVCRAGALCVPLSFACGLWAGVVHLVGVAAAWAYDPPAQGDCMVLGAVRGGFRRVRVRGAGAAGGSRGRPGGLSPPGPYWGLEPIWVMRAAGYPRGSGDRRTGTSAPAGPGRRAAAAAGAAGDRVRGSGAGARRRPRQMGSGGPRGGHSGGGGGDGAGMLPAAGGVLGSRRRGGGGRGVVAAARHRDRLTVRPRWLAHTMTSRDPCGSPHSSRFGFSMQSWVAAGADQVDVWRDE